MGTYANFYNSDNGDRVYDADSFSEWLRPFFKTGVFNGELQVIASSGMEVIVDTGNAFIEGKLKKFDSQTTLTVEQASANSTRIDSVICRRNDTDRDFTLMIVKGTTVAPLPVRENGIYDIVLAHITVPASAVEIKQENITDTRMNADICGWVVSNVEEVDFSQVTAQWADYIANFEADELQAFNEWFDTIKGHLSTDQAGSLQLQIDEQANKIAANTANISSNKADITSLQQTTQTNTSDIATNKIDIQDIKAHDDEQDANIASLEERLYKINNGETTINANGGSIRGIKLYGRSLQDGTPTPDNPIEIQSVVNPKLSVSNSDNTLTQEATLPYTLNAIPVTSGGNVTIDGQQYIADYVDIDKKQLVRNVASIDLLGTESWLLQSINDKGIANFQTSNNFGTHPKTYVICNRLKVQSTIISDTTIEGIRIIASAIFIRILSSRASTVEEFKAWLSSNPLKIIFKSTPTVINLTDEEVQAFKSLNTYEGITNIIDSSEQISGSHKFIYNIADIIDNQCEDIDKLKQLKPVTLGTTWEQDTTNGYYTQTVALSGITSKDNPTIDVVLSGTLEEMQAQQDEWGKILKVETSANILKFYASEVTTVSLTVMVKGV